MLPSLVLLLALFVTKKDAVGESEPASSSPEPATQAERLIFLLQYVAGDYGGAVRDGRVVDEAEYDENKEFTSSIVEQLGRLLPALGSARSEELERSARKLQALVASRGDARQVGEVAESMIPVLVDAFGLRPYPLRRPDPRHAQQLYAENCVPCHGPRGDGDGPRAHELSPPPARFSDPQRLDATAPYAFYNAITLGVNGTAMASFADSLTDQERWDLAFYLWTFRPPTGEERVRAPVTLSLRELATRSSADLAPEVIRQAAMHGEALNPAQAMASVDRMRAEPPVLSDAQERLARLRQDLAGSIALLSRGQSDAAVDRVTTAYLKEFEPLEPEIDRRDPRVRQSFERDLIEFRTVLRRGDRERAIRLARRLEVTADRAAVLLASPPGEARWWWWSAGAGLAALAVIGALLVARRIGKRPRIG